VKTLLTIVHFLVIAASAAAQLPVQFAKTDRIVTIESWYQNRAVVWAVQNSQIVIYKEGDEIGARDNLLATQPISTAQLTAIQHAVGSLPSDAFGYRFSLDSGTHPPLLRLHFTEDGKWANNRIEVTAYSPSWLKQLFGAVSAACPAEWKVDYDDSVMKYQNHWEEYIYGRGVRRLAISERPIRITRYRGWGPRWRRTRISLDEWKKLVTSDPEMRLDGFLNTVTPTGRRVRVENDGLAVWTKCPSHDRDGNIARFFYSASYADITVDNPDKKTFEKMFQLAKKLGANLLDPEGLPLDADGAVSKVKTLPDAADVIKIPAVRPDLPTPAPQRMIALSHIGRRDSCPYYDLTLKANGEVTYSCDVETRINGRGEWKIDPALFELVWSKIEEIHFWDLKERYDSTVEATSEGREQTILQYGGPETEISVFDGHRAKRVIDSFGGPKVLKEFEDLIDHVAGPSTRVRDFKGTSEQTLVSLPSQIASSD